MKIPADQWPTVSRLLDEALDLDADARPAWLDQLAQREPAVGALVQQLLAAHADRETADVLASVPRLPLTAPRATAAQGLTAGERVGPYRLLRELGAGGMAQVWLARRDDGAFVREVALKIPQLSRLRRDLAQRFAQERDILARLEHPHIARLYDAGVSADGLPYLAMEYVDGEPITQWCERRRLNLAQRIALYRQVLDAVQFAHASLVIHRDLKPSNILVTGDGQVRLLDFGIARLLADSTEPSTDSALTQLGGRALTPDYASPEQIRGEPLTIASDQYALGVLLYELLAGQRPYQLTLQSVAQLEQAIVAADVLPPSQRVVEAAAAASGVTPAQLARQLAGDLDAIVLKALARTPAGRYATLSALADDLDRQRDGLPVRAQPPSRAYRLRKFIARHRANVAIGSALAAILFIATAVSLTQAQRAREQADLAQREARRAQAVTRFVTTLFEANSLDSAQAARRRGITAEQLLIEGAERIGTELGGEPALQRELQGVVGRLLHDLSITERALAVRLARLQSIEQAAAGTPSAGGVVTPAEHAAALRDLADSLVQKGDIGAARTRYDEAIMLLRDRVDDAALHWSLVAQAGYLDINAGETARGAARVLEAAQQLARIAPQSIEYAEALILLGEVQSIQNRSDDAVKTLAEGLALAEARLGARSIRLARHQYSVAIALDSQRRHVEAEAHYRQALQTMTELAGPNHAGTAAVQMALGRMLSIRGQPAQARPLLAAAAATLAAPSSDIDPQMAANAQLYQAEALLDEGRIAEAGAPLSAAMKQLASAAADRASMTVAQAIHARYLLDTGRYDEALAQLEQARAKRIAALGADHPTVAALTNRIGLVHMAAGRDAEAERHFAEVDRSQAARESVFGSPRHLAALNRAAMDLERRRPAQALPVIEQALTMFESQPEAARNRTSELALRLRLARALLGLDRAAQAQPHLARAQALAADLYEHAPQRITWHTLQARYLAATGDRAGAREALGRARQSLAAQGVVGPHFARTVQQAEQELGLLAAR